MKPSVARGTPAAEFDRTPTMAAWYGAALILVGCTAGCTGEPPVATTRPETPAPIAGTVAPDDETAVSAGDVPFILTDQAGAPFDSTSLRGRVWMGAIFFSNCPGPCFRENQAIADILREIDDPNFVVVSLTCDPENDTPDVLRRYADRFEADPSRWKFLTGDMGVIRSVGLGLFKLPVEVGVHSERGVVFDREGRLRGGYHLLQEDRVTALKRLIRDVLAEIDDTSGSPGDGKELPP